MLLTELLHSSILSKMNHTTAVTKATIPQNQAGCTHLTLTPEEGETFTVTFYKTSAFLGRSIPMGEVNEVTPDQLEEVYQRVKQIKDIHEPHLKKHLNILLKDAVITKENNAGLFSRVNDFLQKDYRYFFNDEFKNDELNTLTTIAVNAADACNDYRFRQYKYMLDQQWNLYEASMQ